MPTADTTARDAARAAGREQVAALKAARDEAHKHSAEAHEYADALMWHQIGALIRSKTIRQADAAEITGYSRDRVLKQTTRYAEKPIPPRAETRPEAQAAPGREESTMPRPETAPVLITSFGYLHGLPPEGADLVVDLRRHFKDPHVAPELRYLTAHDEQVRAAVRQTPGIPQLVAATAAAVLAYQAEPSASGHPVHIAPGCAGGRHRAASFARDLQAALAALGVAAVVEDRDLDKPVLDG